MVISALGQFIKIFQAHWVGVTLVAAWLGMVLLAAEWAYRRTNWGPEVSRKIVHIGTGNIILLAWWFQIPAILGILASIFFSLLTLLSYRYPVLPSVSGIGRQSWGTFFYALSIGVLIAWFWPDQPEFAALGILIMAWGDGCAAIIGQRWGKHHYEIAGIQKSWEGSATIAGISLLLTLLLLGPGSGMPLLGRLGLGLSVAVVATGLEAFSRWGIDNLTVPLGSAGLAWFILNLAWGHLG